MVTTINQLSFTWLIYILVSNLVVNQGQVINQEQLRKAWFATCFMEGFKLDNLTSTDCKELKLNGNLTRVPELKDLCLSYHQLGCTFGKANSFCNVGISKALSNLPNIGFTDCAEIDIAEDVANNAFECCLTCKTGFTDADLKSNCIYPDSSVNLPEMAQERCCKTAVSFKNTNLLVNSSTVEPDLLNSSDNFTVDEISEIVRNNDIMINSSLALILSKNSSQPVTPMTTELTSKFTVEPTTESVSSTTDVTSTISVTPTTLIGDKTTSTVTISTPKEESVSTTIITSVSFVNTDLPSSTTPEPTLEPKRWLDMDFSKPELNEEISTPKKSCKNGYELNDSDECEDIDECKDFEICPESTNCYNTNGSFKCCPKGTEMNQQHECVYIDHCERKPCFQSEDDQHYCVNYFVGRECIDKLEEEYTFVNGNNGTQRFNDWANDKSKPKYLDLSQKEVILRDVAENYKNRRLILLELPKKVKCDWDFKLEKVWSPIEDDKLNVDQFDLKTEASKFIATINGPIKPQSIEVSITCKTVEDQIVVPIYRNTIYFTFKPKDLKYKVTKDSGDDEF